MTTLEPPDADALASMLRWANEQNLAVLPRGSGTKLDWGSSPERVDALLSTRHLINSIDHAAGDLVATVPAGASLAAVNSALGREGQWLPLDPPYGDRATIGGIVATNDSGPRRHRYGTPRDLIIGVGMALADGRTAKAGGRVVKNVAGYDLSRLLCGSYGSLAVVTSATFKLSPLAPASRTVVATLQDLQSVGTLVQALHSAPLTPSTIEIDCPSRKKGALLQLLIRFESTESAANRQAAAAAAICQRGGATTTTLADAGEIEMWRGYHAGMWDTAGTVVKIAVLPTDVQATIEAAHQISERYGVDCRLGGRAALGVLLVHLSLNPGGHPGIIFELRRDATGRRGSLVVLSADPSVRVRIDPWGDIGDALPLMRAVKARFDPKGTLSPGRGPGGL